MLHIVVRAGGEDVLSERVHEVQGLRVDPGRRDAGGSVELKSEGVLDFVLR